MYGVFDIPVDNTEINHWFKYKLDEVTHEDPTVSHWFEQQMLAVISGGLDRQSGLVMMYLTRAKYWMIHTAMGRWLRTNCPSMTDLREPDTMQVGLAAQKPLIPGMPVDLTNAKIIDIDLYNFPTKKDADAFAAQFGGEVRQFG